MYNIIVKKENLIGLAPSEEMHISDELRITDLRGRHFIVPAYQRGYKWRRKDVEYLIRDLAEYEGFNPYYMQPIVVAKDGDKYILVDGQQRLTTFYLIWRKLFLMQIVDTAPSFCIEYEKRDESTVYLYRKELINNNITPDIRHFQDAERIMDDEDLSVIICSGHFLKNFFEKATFLWYVLEDVSNGPKMYERLNGKRIALTDVELCKVLLLSADVTSKTVRSERAMAWQNMEYRLHDNSFYAFICKDYSERHDYSRMDVILRAICRNDIDKLDIYGTYDEYPLYSSLKKQISNKINVWKNIVNTFHRIEKWYDNLLYYNLIGFIIESIGTPIHVLLKDAAHADFGERLRNRIIIWSQNGTSFRELEYKNDKTKSALLLFNILCDMYIKSNPVSEKLEDKYGFTARFRFDLYRSEKPTSIS